MEERLLKYFRDHEAEIFGDLERLVKAEASTSDLEALPKQEGPGGFDPGADGRGAAGL